MKLKYTLVLFAMMITVNLLSQDSVDVLNISLDMLHAPSSPAFQILEFSDDKIERPTNPTDFWLSIKEATENFSVIPKNYALDINLYGVLKTGKETPFNEYSGNNIWQNIKQTTGLSVGTIALKDSLEGKEYRKISFGIKISILTGKPTVEFKNKQENINKVFLAKRNDIEKYFEKTNKTKYDKYKKLDGNKTNSNQSEQEELSNLKLEWEKYKEQDSAAVVNDIEESKFERKGWKLDFSCAFGLDFHENDIRSGYLSKYGLWLTGGYEWDNAPISALGVARFIFTPRQKLENSVDTIETLGNFDFGGKFIVDGWKNISFSGELLGRLFFKNDNTAKTEKKFRYTFGISYEIYKNKSLTFNIGKEFDKSPKLGGNLILALGLVLGFGSERNILSN